MSTQLVKGILAAVVFVACVSLVFIGQQTTGWANLGVMLLGLTGLIVLLYLYNRKYR